MKGIFFLGGFLAGILLSVMDFFTMYIAFQRQLPVTSVFYLYVPPVMASLALAMNASASHMINMIQNKKESQFSIFLTGISFVICIVFDMGTSLVGCITEFGGSHDLGIAWKNLTSMQFICALVVALFVTIGPFLTARFHELIVEEGGIMACFSGAFFPQRTEIVEVEE